MVMKELIAKALNSVLLVQQENNVISGLEEVNNIMEPMCLTTN